MIDVVFMCVVLSAGLPCTPYRDMDACLTAERGLAIELVDQSECAPARVIRPYHPALWEWEGEPPKPRPARYRSDEVTTLQTQEIPP
jgi:hypothetical protein